jgi:hypothetical protein
MNDLTQFGDLSPWTKCPPFWAAKPEHMPALQQATRRVIGRSAGQREIIALEYGEKEATGATMDNLHSAIVTKLAPADPTDIYPDEFYGTRRRRKPVIAIQGGIHGSELTGTVAGFNLCQVIETGQDLRGKAWPRLAELARGCRVVFIPWLNPDGVARWPTPNPTGLPHELYQRINQGVLKDGTPLRYPEVKKYFPIPIERVSWLGAYYNDAGVNLQYDFCTVRRQPETTAWMEYYLAERPDGILVSHCNAGTMIDTPEYYTPPGHQHLVNRLGGAVRARLLREGFAIGRLSWGMLPGMGKPFLSQIGAIYHVCGGTPFLCEFPVGTKEYPFSLDAMLDIGLLTFEEVLAFAHADGFRPYELWAKVKKTLPA